MRFTTLVVVCASTAIPASALADWNPGDPSKMHYPQLPDPTGIDVDNTSIPGTPLRWVADDFRCSQTGPITDIHFWYSLRHDLGAPPNNNLLAAVTAVHARLYSDVPSSPNGLSHPGTVVWSADFATTQFTPRIYGSGQQSWWDPFFSNTFLPNDHQAIMQINITNISQPFVQQQGQIYWLALQLDVANNDIAAGWKTSGSPQFNDPAVYGDGTTWNSLFDPRIVTAAVPLDLAFVITPTPGAASVLGLGALVALRRRR